MASGRSTQRTPKPSARRPWRIAALEALLLLAALPARAQEPPADPGARVLSVPYVFFNDAFGAAAGFAYGGAGFPQKQATLLATVIVGTNNAYAWYLISRDILLPGTERLFLDSDLSMGHFGTIRSFIDGNPAFTGQRAGSNDSDPKNYVEGSGNDDLARVNFRFLLPTGSGRAGMGGPPVLERGLPAAGTSLSWNPLESGRTYLEARPYWRSQSFEGDDGRFAQKTNGIAFSVFRDNTDFAANPSMGSTVRVRYTRDWGLMDSSRPYAVYDAEFSKYVPFGSSARFRQRVLALDLWTAQVPTWNDSSQVGGAQVDHRPPAYLGPTLGGLWRLRGYPTARFNDAAAIYYSAEYRVIPAWNPFDAWAWSRRMLGVAWWQWAAFAEAGRVAPAWSVSGLHSDMKWDAGVGIRAMAKGVVVRVDFARSNQETSVSMIVGQPFQF